MRLVSTRTRGRRVAIHVRTGLLLAVCGGCASSPPSPPAPAPAPAAAAAATPCVIQEGEPQNVFIKPDSAYAAGAEWFERKEPIVFRGLYHIQYGLPYVVPAAELARAGDYRGIPVFTRTGDARWAGFIFIPVRHGCVFQAYEPPHRP